MTHRVWFEAAEGPVDVEAPTFEAAIGLIVDALASEVRPVAVFSDHGAQYAPEIVERAVLQRLYGAAPEAE